MSFSVRGNRETGFRGQATKLPFPSSRFPRFSFSGPGGGGPAVAVAASMR